MGKKLGSNVGYNPIMDKTQPQKLVFLDFFSYFGRLHAQNSTFTFKTNTLYLIR